MDSVCNNQWRTQVWTYIITFAIFVAGLLSACRDANQEKSASSAPTRDSTDAMKPLQDDHNVDLERSNAFPEDSISFVEASKLRFQVGRLDTFMARPCFKFCNNPYGLNESNMCMISYSGRFLDSFKFSSTIRTLSLPLTSFAGAHVVRLFVRGRDGVLYCFYTDESVLVSRSTSTLFITFLPNNPDWQSIRVDTVCVSPNREPVSM